MALPLDDLDRRLIARLQANARASTAELARQLGVARTTVVARIARLESSGAIDALVDEIGEIYGVPRTTNSVLLAMKMDRVA